MSQQKRISTQDIAAVLVEELNKVEQHVNRLATLEPTLKQNLAHIQNVNQQYIIKLNEITTRKLTIDTSKLETTLKSQCVLPKWAVWVLILQPFIIGIITTLLVWTYIDDVETVAWNRGKSYAIEQLNTDKAE